MGLFAPWFLAGLVALGLPVYLHLLRRHKTEPKPFGSLMFFERRTQSSVKHRRLRFYVLLALRLAMLALLALLFAQPYVSRGVAGIGGKKLVLIAVDHSFSMRQGDRLARAKAAASSAIDSLGHDVAQVVALGSRVESLTEPVSDRAELKAAVASIAPGDGTSSFAEFSRFVRGLPAAVNLPVEAHLFSDMQQTSMPSAFADLALADRTKLVPHVIGSAEPNWTVERVTAPREAHGSEKVRVQAVIAGYNTQPARKTASLAVGGRIVDSKPVDVPASGRATVEFAGFDPAYGFNKAAVRIEPADSLTGDDSYLFAVERTETRKVLFVRDSRQSPTFLKAALSSAAGETYDLETVTVAQAANIDPSRYSMVILADAAPLPKDFEDRLRQFAERGGGVLAEAGPATIAAGRVPVADLKVSESRYSTRGGDRFQAASRVDGGHPAIRDARLLEGAKVYQSARIDPAGARIIARLSDDSPLLVEKAIGQGKVVVIASTLDNVANDFPVHASFVPFVERLAAYLSGVAGGLSSVAVDSTAPLRSEGERGTAVEVLDPDGKRALDLRQATTASVFTFPREGYWEVRNASGRREMYAVNADRRESDLTRVPDEALALWSGSWSNAPGSGASGEKREPERISLWKWVMAALLACALAESIIADRFQSAAEPVQEIPIARGRAA
jgi:hypothetical protein